MTTETATSKKVISDKSAQAQRLIRNSQAKSTIADIKKAQGNDVDKDEDEVQEGNVPEVVVDEKAIEQARATVEKAKASYEHAKTALALLLGKPLKMSSGPGVISSILQILEESEEGVTKAEILEQLVVLFPEREKDGMQKTINVQLGKGKDCRMSKEKKVDIIKTEDGKFKIE
jgi:hypothetical protein